MNLGMITKKTALLVLLAALNIAADVVLAKLQVVDIDDKLKELVDE